jgi:hypothetical protein
VTRKIRITASLMSFSGWLLVGAAAIAGTYSVTGANAYVGRQDWNGLVRYSSAWAEAEPRAAMPWYFLGNTYGIGLHQPAQAVRAFEKAVALQPHWENSARSPTRPPTWSGTTSRTGSVWQMSRRLLLPRTAEHCS